MRSLLPLLAAAFLAAAAPAAAAPTWLPPVNLSPAAEPSVTEPSIAGDDAGHVAALWLRDDAAMGVTYHVDYSLRSPGGGFTPAKQLSAAGASAESPAAAMDASGTATMAWIEDGALKVARVGADGGVSPVQTVVGAGASESRVAVAPNGAAVLVWHEGGRVRAATRPNGGADFTGSAPVSAAGGMLSDPFSTHVAVDDAGDAVVIWARDDVIEANARPAGGSFEPAGTPVSTPGEIANNAVLAMSPAGHATALWIRVTLPGPIFVIQTAERTISPSFAGGTWSAPLRASPPPPVQATGAAVAVDASNTAVALWKADDGMNQTVQAATRPSGGVFSGFQPLSGGASDFSAKLDVAPSGAAVATWLGRSGARPAVQSASRPAGGTFGGVSDIALGDAASDPQELPFSPAVAIDDQANAAAVWMRQRFSVGLGINEWRVDAAGYDAAPPTLTAVSVPPSASARASVGMAAAATDRWTGSAIAWSFGDGASAPGDAVTHAFGTAGAFNVTATATDGVGNASAATRPILITGPTTPPRIDSTVQSKWGFDRKTGKRFYLFRLKVVAPPRQAAAQLRCAGKRCPFQSRRFTKRRKGAITLYKVIKTSKVLKKKNRRFRAGQTLQLRITAPGFTGKVVKYKLKRRKQPVGKVLCLPEGAKKPRKC